MRIQTVTQAILLLVLANFLASLSDVSLKVLNGEVPTFQYVFIRQVMSLLIIGPLWLKLPKQERMLGCGKINFWRAQFILIGSGCAMVAITHLTLATANAMFYVAPLLMLPLCMVFLKERPARKKVFATMIGFMGVLVVLRPEHFHWAAIIALGSALAMAVGNVLIKRLPPAQSVISTLFWTTVLTIPGALLLALPSWASIQWHHLFWIAAINIFVLSYHALVVIAYKKAPASQIALAEYSGLVFVTIFGILWFDEIPDILTLMGIAMIVVPLMPIRWRRKSSTAEVASDIAG
ncbi:multidrug transporter [Vibrio sp. UCD-FRSSP16_10]|uniref:DMT family transporter n=1 Tax=unclassified Vibrio TaxID=2614977 RepID=UPI0007FC40DF|nr:MULTISPECIES: DMT family transporter [unclassified Vibrio]OBT08535.1 multidrug transporter [Vibrio sp. UCD-FRSSP16_30]OBT18065.1 multidrug transporter [Vibrio sp. UCD-FRSSP16_10]